MYVQSLKTDKEPVGEEAIIALSNMCQREVHVYTAHVEPLVYKPVSGIVKGEPVLLAFFEPGHYRAVLRNGDHKSEN
jgi:hypothetical protein